MRLILKGFDYRLPQSDYKNNNFGRNGNLMLITAENDLVTAGLLKVDDKQ